MEHQVLAEGSLTFGQFEWLWIGGMSVFGALFILGGMVISRSQRVRRLEVRQTLMGLIRAGVLREKDITQALAAPHLPPDASGVRGQAWLNRILDGSPLIEQLIYLWKRPLWVDASIYAGIGTFLACGVCAIFFLTFPAMPNVSASYGLLLAVMMSLPLIGMLIGVGTGLSNGRYKAATTSRQPFADQARPLRSMEQYHLRWLRWGGVVLFLVPLILTLSALPFLSKDLMEMVVISLVALPLLTLGALLLHEHFISRLAYLRPVRVGVDSALEERFDLFFFPRLMAGIRLVEYGILATMMLGQLMLILGAVRQEATVVYANILLGLVFSYLLLPVIVSVVQQWLSERRNRGQTGQERATPGTDRAAP